jgi:hypothetical protein
VEIVALLTDYIVYERQHNNLRESSYIYLMMALCGRSMLNLHDGMD